MEIRFGCESCGQHIEVEESARGQRVACPQCGRNLTVPVHSTIPAPSSQSGRDIAFDCTKCGQQITIDEAGAGQLVNCPKCGKPLEVPYHSKPAQPLAKKCPHCAETIKAEAKVCRFCGYDLVTGHPPARIAESASTRASGLIPKILIVLLVIAVVVAGGFFAYSLRKAQQVAKTTLAGEVFIVTTGGESMKLGLVEVGLFPMITLEPFLSKRATEKASEVARLEPLIAAAKGEVSRLEKAKRAAEDAVEAAETAAKGEVSRLEKAKRAAEDAARRMAMVGTAVQAADANLVVAEAELAAARANLERLESLAAGRRAMNNPYRDAVFKANEAQWKLEREYAYLCSGTFYFRSLPAPVRATKTDSDGRFSLPIPAEGEFAIGAQAFREVGGYIERYYWLLRVHSQPGQTQTIMLSNDNMTSSASRDSLIRTRD